MSSSSPALPVRVNDRYDIKDALGRGGMGIVYRAYDNVTKRFVALKTVFGDAGPDAGELFEKEWTVLARLSHPNIVDILDTGEYNDQGQRRPYFVMPLLPGVTLERLIKNSSHRLTVERSVDIICQACRGLQAAHDQGLFHRDLKPSNIFVMEGDAVKIIDFGIVHLADSHSVTGIKGTLQYMAPEQLEMKPASALSDIFSLAVVTYETLTGRKPFSRNTEGEVVDAIRSHIPPSASEINPAVNQLLSRTVHKGMAKQAWHRFSSAREFGDTLQKALRNEPIERFERTKLQPRIERIRKAFGEGDHQFALEILTELESEGHIDPDMSALRIQIDQGLRQKTIRQLLEGARTRLEEDEFPLALQKLSEVLSLDPNNFEAQSLKGKIERQRSENQIENWFHLVQEHLGNKLYGQARQALQEILKIDSANSQARRTLAEIDQTEQEDTKLRDEKRRLYDGALEAYRSGEITTALTKLERILGLNPRNSISSTPDLDAQCQSLYNEVRSERDAARNAYAEARKHLLDRNALKTIELCDAYLLKHPGDPMFQALKLEAGEMQRHDQSAAVGDLIRRVDAEPDLGKQHSIIQEAVEKYPNEQHFKDSLKSNQTRRDLVDSIVGRARHYEERGQFNDASGQWDILRNIYPAYAGIAFELERLTRRKEEQSQAEAKAHWMERIDRHFAIGEYAKAGETIAQALTEFPGDKELLGLESLAGQGVRRSAEAGVLIHEGQRLCEASNFEAGLAALRKAERLDPRHATARATLLGALVTQARGMLPQEWPKAEPLVSEALQLDANDPIARSLAALIEDYRRQDSIGKILVEARSLQAQGDIAAALRQVEDGLSRYPNEIRLSQLHNTLRNVQGEARPEANPVEPAATQFSFQAPPPAPIAPPEASDPVPVVLPLPPATAKRPLWHIAAPVAAVLLIAAAIVFSLLHKGKAAGSASSVPTSSTLPSAVEPTSAHVAPVVASPAGSELRIGTSIKSGHVVLDDAPAADLQEGSFTKAGIQPGDHTLKIFDGSKPVFAFSFHAEPGALMSLPEPLARQSLPGLVVSSLAGSAKVYATPGMRGGAAGQLPQPVPPAGVDLVADLQNPPHFIATDGVGPVLDATPDTSSSPVLSVMLSGGPGKISVTISANVADAIIVLGGAPMKRHLQNGVRVLPLEPGLVTIKLTHDGYQDSAEQTLTLKASDPSPKKLSFTLVPISRTAVLSFVSAPPDAAIFLDSVRIGTIPANGQFSRDVSAGNHSIELKKPGFEDFSKTVEFKAGDTVKIEGDAFKVKAIGTLALKVLPANAHISVHREGDAAPTTAANNQSVTLRSGLYVVTAGAEGYANHTETVTIEPGKTIAAEWQLQPPTPPQRIPTAELFEDPKSWAQDQETAGWWIHASGTAYLRFTEGAFSFDILKGQQGIFKKKKISFVADSKPDGSRVTYSLDGHNLVRRNAGGEEKIPHGMDAGATFRIIVDMTADAITIKNRAGAVLDTVKRSGAPGKFGFQDSVELTGTKIR